MRYDQAASDEGDRIFEAWFAKLMRRETLEEIARFVAKYHGGTPYEIAKPVSGSFNVSLVVHFHKAPSALIRFPKPGFAMFPEEKARSEVATMRYLQAHTTIKIPLILHSGTKEKSPCQLGPFIIMEYVENVGTVAGILRKPWQPGEHATLDPDIDEGRLLHLYRQMADIVLQLSRLYFSKIGALQQPQEDQDRWEISTRPLTYNMNELVQLGSLPRAELPRRHNVFENTTSFYQHLAHLHLRHFICQRNDALESKEDGQSKYASRCVFAKCLSSLTSTEDKFRVWCDDLRPSNMLVNAQDDIVCVIDWEYAYSAPEEFSKSPPWWLLLEAPEDHIGGFESWMESYQPRLQLFLRALAEREDSGVRPATADRLSDAMRRTWESGDFWIYYAARKSFAFDRIFFGPLAKRMSEIGVDLERRNWWTDAVGSEQRAEMEKVVGRKLEEKKTRYLQWEPDEPTLN